MNNLLPDILRVALLGSERVNLNPKTQEALTALGLSANAPSGDASAAATSFPQAGDSAGYVLQAGFLAYQAQRAGYIPLSLPDVQPQMAPPEDLPACNEEAMRALDYLLHTAPRMLPEFIQFLEAGQQRIHENYLPTLLNLGRQQSELWPSLRRIIGERGEWLAAQNPDWHYLLPDYNTQTWQTGERAQRIALLQHWRHVDPSVALELLTATWQQEAPSDKVDFLKVLNINLSDDDLPLLQRAAQSSRQEVRRMAHHLITKIPNAPYTQHLFQRLTELLSVKRTLRGAKLDVKLPNDSDKALLNNFHPKQSHIQSGQRGLLLARLIQAAPLDQLAAHYDCTAIQWIKLCHNSEWRALLMQAMIYAIRRQANTAWAGRLAEFWLIDQKDNGDSAAHDCGPLLDTCTPAQFNRLCAQAIVMRITPPLKGRLLDVWMRHYTQPWDEAWSRQWATHYRNWLVSGKEAHLSFSYQGVLQHIAYYIHPEASIPILQDALKTEVTPSNSLMHRMIESLLELLHFRANMRRSLIPQ